MSTTLYKTQICELISLLQKAAPKSCSKPKSEMCSNCRDRVFGQRAQQINHFIELLTELKKNNEKLTASLETEVIELLNTK